MIKNKILTLALLPFPGISRIYLGCKLTGALIILGALALFSVRVRGVFKKHTERFLTIIGFTSIVFHIIDIIKITSSIRELNPTPPLNCENNEWEETPKESDGAVPLSYVMFCFSIIWGLISLGMILKNIAFDTYQHGSHGAQGALGRPTRDRW